MKLALIIVAALVILVAIVLAIGAMLPVSHTVSRSITVKRDRRTVYDVIRDVASHPQWRKNVQTIEVLSPTQFRELSKNGAVTYAIDEDEPARRLVTRIVDRNLGYSGSWTYAFDDEPSGGTRVTITENGQVTNVLFRFMSRFVFGHTATIDAYLKALEERLR